jgi:hypothetical protein
VQSKHIAKICKDGSGSSSSDSGKREHCGARWRVGTPAIGLLTFIATIATPLLAESAQDQQSQPVLASGDLFTPSFKALFVLFILAVIIESGLAVIFNWKPFVSTFDTKATKPIIAVLVACAFVFGFHLDITTTLVNLYTGTNYPISFGGQLLTAFVIAGGSAGVNNLLQALGFRSVQQASPPPPKPPPTLAWLAVTLVRSQAVGRVSVVAGPTGSPKLVGTIAGAGLRHKWLRFFIQDNARFPPSGGHTLQPGIFEVQLRGVDKAGSGIQSVTWGPYDIAPGSIIDLELTL